MSARPDRRIARGDILRSDERGPANAEKPRPSTRRADGGHAWRLDSDAARSPARRARARRSRRAPPARRNAVRTGCRAGPPTHAGYGRQRRHGGRLRQPFSRPLPIRDGMRARAARFRRGFVTVDPEHMKTRRAVGLTKQIAAAIARFGARRGRGPAQSRRRADALGRRDQACKDTARHDRSRCQSGPRSGDSPPRTPMHASARLRTPRHRMNPRDIRGGGSNASAEPSSRRSRGRTQGASGPTRTTTLPKFFPPSSPISVCGAASSPSTTSSRSCTLPCATHSPISFRNAG